LSDNPLYGFPLPRESSSSSSTFFPHFGQRTCANAGGRGERVVVILLEEQIYPSFLLARDFKKEAVTEQLFRARFYSKKKGFTLSFY
jgi:hypothetical protein